MDADLESSAQLEPPSTPSERQRALTAELRCYYAAHTASELRPDCQGVAVVAYGPIALCGMCDTMRSAVARTHDPRRLPGAELAQLIDAAQALAKAQADVADAIGRARAAGASWSQIGDAVGVSRQGAQQRWGHVADHPRLANDIDSITEPMAEEVIAPG